MVGWMKWLNWLVDGLSVCLDAGAVAGWLSGTRPALPGRAIRRRYSNSRGPVIHSRSPAPQTLDPLLFFPPPPPCSGA